MSWKPEVFVEGQWSRNGLVFSTQEEAKQYAHDLFQRWSACTDHRAVEADDPVNYTYHNHHLQGLVH